MSLRSRRGIALLITTFLVLAAAVHARSSPSTGAGAARVQKKQFPRLALSFRYACELDILPPSTYPTVPAEVMVYKVKPVASKKQALLELLKALQFASRPEARKQLRHLESMPEEEARKENPLGLSLGGWTVEVWDGGQFYASLYRRTEDVPAPPFEKARAAADSVLRQIAPLLPMSVEYSAVDTGVELIRGTGDSIVTRLNVSYSAELDGIPVSGGVGMQVGAGPSVTSISSHLRQIAPYARVPILTPREAFKELSAGRGIIQDYARPDVKGRVKSVKLVYWQGILAEDLAYVMPVYVFEGEPVVIGNWHGSWRGYVDAVRPEYLKEESDGK